MRLLSADTRFFAVCVVWLTAFLFEASALKRHGRTSEERKVGAQSIGFRVRGQGNTGQFQCVL